MMRIPSVCNHLVVCNEFTNLGRRRSVYVHAHCSLNTVCIM